MLPVGIISLWSGSIANIPTGWALCNGALGTPNLRDRFVIGAGGAHAVDNTGGSIGHTHTFTGDGHNHTLLVGLDIGSGSGFNNTSDSVPAVGTTDSEPALPPFYALAYIMRI